MEQEVTPVEETAEVSTEEVAQEPEVKEEVAPVEEGEIVIPPPKKKQTAQERIDEITKARREAEREAEYWRKTALGKVDAQPKPQAEPHKPAVDGRPTIDKFETAEQYEDALIAWHDEQREARIRKERLQEEEAQLVEKFKERAVKVREIYEDFDEVVNQPVFSPVMRNALLRSENGAEVSYFLARPENQSITAKIKSLTPELQIYELGKLEAKLDIAKKTKKTTKAPEPIAPIDTTGAGGGLVDESKLTDDEWYALRQKREMEKLKKKLGG